MVMCALALAAGAPIALGAGSPYGNATANRQAAQTAAPQLLALLQMPPGTTMSASDPAPDGALSQIGYNEATPNLVDADAFWTTGDSASEVLAYVKAHLPSDAKAAGYSGISGPNQPSDSSYFWALPPVPGVLGQRVLALSLTELSGGQVAARTDGEAVWLTPRPSWERIPAGVQSVTFVVRGTSPSGRPGPPSSQRTLRGARARRLTAMINRLGVVQPGAYSCPASFASSVRLRFSARGRTVARATEQPTGCASVQLTVGGRRGRALQDSPSVTDDLIRLGAIPTCPRGALEASLSRPGRDGGPMTRGTEVKVINRSASVCRLRGYPGVGLLGADGAGLPARVHRVGARFLRGEGVEADVVLGAGGAANFSLQWTACHVTPARLLRFSLPRVAGAFVVPVRGTIAPCGGRLGVGDLTLLP